MSFRRVRPDHRAGLLLLVALGFALPAFAQDASRDSSDQHEGFCSSAGCRWSAVSAGVLIGTLSVAPANRAERMSVSLPHTATSATQITPEACAACKVNARPFDVPPGILEKLMAQLGLGRRPNAHSRNGAGAQAAGGSEVGDGSGGASTGASIASDNSGGASGGGTASGSGGTNGVGNAFGAAAVGGGPGVSAALTAADVTVTPEPQTAVLVATGLIVLVPVSRRMQRRR